MRACAHTRVPAPVCACASVWGLRHCLSCRYAMAEIPCYHWALGLANAVWTRDWTRHVCVRVLACVCGHPRVRVFWKPGGPWGEPAAAPCARGFTIFCQIFRDPSDGRATPGRRRGLRGSWRPLKPCEAPRTPETTQRPPAGDPGGAEGHPRLTARPHRRH